MRIIAVIASLAIGGRAAAQPTPPRGGEVHFDAVAARRGAVEAAAGVIVPAGVYSRTAFLLAAGAESRGSGWPFVGRAEIVSRFLLDPFRESPLGLSVGGGLGVTNLSDPERWQPYLALVLDLEMRQRAGITPALQLGLGGGTRLGLVLRTGTERWR
jgi:hypothetical protein